MNKSNLRNFAVMARTELIERVKQKAYELGITEEKVKKARIEASDAIYINGKALDSVQVKQRDSLIAAIDKKGYTQVMEEIAYTWFNRFCALRFMEINDYLPTGVRVLSSTVAGSVEPDIMREAFNLDFDFSGDKERETYREKVYEMKEKNDQNGLFKYLVIKQCNSLHDILPFLFEKIEDCSEILFPDNLLQENSFLRNMTNPEIIPEEDWQEVEIIGWLYQYYISEKKDEVFANLKKNIKISKENIPAATQLFTPHWIVGYLAENSLGRLWMLNHPQSRLIEKMEYYIKPEQDEEDYLIIKSPEEIKVCDPACGSGHMLVYAFDLLYAIYEEAGYMPTEIPEKILTHNLYGIEIDKRAGELAAFALVMKARQKHRRFFRQGIQPHICVLENIHFEEDELKNYQEEIGHDLFTANLFPTLRLFEEADNFGSLIRPVITDVSDILQLLEAQDLSGNLFFNATHQKVLQALQQVDYLSPKYHVVIANPPYMGGRGMNGRLKVFADKNYPDSKSDLFAMFIERGFDLIVERGYNAMVTMQSWMFLSSFEKLRESILNKYTIISMAHLGARAFDSIGGEVVSTTAFVINNDHYQEYKGAYLRLVDGRNEAEKEEELILTRDNPYRASAADFKKIPGSPITYWVSEKIYKIIDNSQKLGDISEARMGLATGNNDRYTRLWFECSLKNIGFSMLNRTHAQKSALKWFPYCKGGNFRRWYGNNEYVVDWYNDGKQLQCNMHPSGTRVWAHNFNLDYIFCDSITWSDITSGILSVRFNDKGFLFDGSGTCAFFKDSNQKLAALGLLNTSFVRDFSKVLNPTLHFQTGDYRVIPYRTELENRDFLFGVRKLINLSRIDWDSYETSWDFTELPLLKPEYHEPTLQETYQGLRTHWQEMTLEIQRLEEENNRIFIDAYSLQDELTPEVPLSEITLTCNPYYRYGDDKSEEELEERLLLDTIKEYISYAVGCMFGRYSLDQEGLAFAGGDFEPSLYKTFPADRDNVIPILAEDYFSDDIVTRFVDFVRITFGAATLEENLEFIADTLGKRAKETARDTIRRYFLNDFYKDHVQTYKKRPIYWLFTSGKEKAFNALVYLHRYQPATVAILRTDYLHRLQDVLEVEKQHLQRTINDEAGSSSARKAAKELTQLDKQTLELKKYEELVHHYADMRIPLDLDDGVKVNYAKLGELLAKI
ncbi:BREX-1 system adenine-specific DNA-methyltransferase PglX [Syntrophomonas wolfei]|uniref:site-specific DNA-methyltransferase (adenine-specific) n=1 Tax=Syntrophomonas wolfei subsp. wolfei (strain DSM 2245B / Goettingen) TaxID=335541 RepID=Q0AU22_SYNWW|nr:BREX-1 system adenine-specific DNA-methyltransferase PglX [Syntrophomonas wolfei]ABI69782.1 type IIS restriction enzyme [Syntrophomonas wolfei subsp. wolfei str. Goettingen G311]